MGENETFVVVQPGATLYADAFNGVVWRDDSQVVRVVSEKRYNDRPGVLVTVKEVRT